MAARRSSKVAVDMEDVSLLADEQRRDSYRMEPGNAYLGSDLRRVSATSARYDLPGTRRRKKHCCSRWPTVSLILVLTTLAAGSVGWGTYSNRTTLSKASVAALHYAGLDPLLLNKTAELDDKAPYVYATPRPDLEPYEEHPILGLIRRAKTEWAEKQASQSETYEEAVAEYKRRNGWEPPPGFKGWYDFATKNNVQLIDEYDSISASLLPFRSLPPSTIRSRTSVLVSPPQNHALIRIKNHTWLPPTGATWRPAVVQNWKDLLTGIEHLVRDVEIPVYLHDGAKGSLDWDARQRYEEAARAGEFVDESLLPLAGDTAYSIRDRECAPDSRFRRVREGIEQGSPVGQGPAFVGRHHAAMDYCNNPDFMQIHGAVATVWGLGPLTPSFAMAKQNFHGDILWPAGILYDLNPALELPFLQKKTHKIVWRGSLDGMDVHPDNSWRSSHRYRLAALSTSNATLPRSLRLTANDTFGREYQYSLPTTLGALNERYTNMRPTGKPLQCDKPLCAAIQNETVWGKFLTKEEMSDHRFVMDVDGNSYSARFRTHLLSNQLVLKSTVFAGWYSERIQPWLHYVPARVDYDDLYNILAFFNGDLSEERRGNHDALAAKIAEDGKFWAEGFWREVDMQAYTLRLLLEYARVLDPSRTPQDTVAKASSLT